MQDWWECPEAMGPQTEGAINNINYGDPGQISIGAIPHRLPPEVRDRERADDYRKYEVRMAAERAAIAAGQSALEAATTADKILREAAEIAAKVSS